MDQIIERWLPVPGWEGCYEVSDQGRVRSLDRKRPCQFKDNRIYRGQMLTPLLHGSGYRQVSLKDNGRTNVYFIHRLVILAFVGSAPREDYQCAHNDGNKDNNALENLRWATRSENNQDKNKHGTSPRGSRNPNNKLTEEDVKMIRLLYVRGNQGQLAELYGVTQSAISHIVRRRVWAYI